jgi:hypothetical protein
MYPVARRSVKRPTQTEPGTDRVADAAVVTAPETLEDTDIAAGAAGSDTVLHEDDTSSTDVSDTRDGSDTPADNVPAAEAVMALETEAAAPPETRTIVERRGPGFVPLVLGGVIAAGIGYGAAYLGLLPVPQSGGDTIGTTVERQQASITGLEAQISEMANATPPTAEAVDLSPVTNEVAALSSRLDEVAGTITGLTTRVDDLEARPLFTGEGNTDSAAMAAAVATLQSQLGDSQTANAAMAAEVEELVTQAQDSIAAAEARAQQSVAAATAQAGLSQLRIAIAAGDPFAGVLSDLAEATGIAVPEGLTAAAETGVPTLDRIEAAYAVSARAALPIALRETAGDGTANRLGAFFMGQVGGRSLEPREGDDPDAILSRVGAAVEAGDLDTALTELGALPEPAQAVMADWVALVQSRTAATDALAELATALDQSE